jgi:hypothetical protein
MIRRHSLGDDEEGAGVEWKVFEVMAANADPR